MAFIKEIKQGKRRHYVLCRTFIDDSGKKRQESRYIGLKRPRGRQKGLRWPGKRGNAYNQNPGGSPGQLGENIGADMVEVGNK